MTAIKSSQESAGVGGHILRVLRCNFTQKIAFFRGHCLHNKLLISSKKHKCSTSTFAKLFLESNPKALSRQYNETASARTYLCSCPEHSRILLIGDSVAVTYLTKRNRTIRPKPDRFFLLNSMNKAEFRLQQIQTYSITFSGDRYRNLFVLNSLDR